MSAARDENCESCIPAGYSGAEVIPVPSRLPAQYRARQQLTGDNFVAPANNLHTLIPFLG